MNLRILLLASGVTTVGDFASLSGITFLFYRDSSVLNLAYLQSFSSLFSVIFSPFLGRLSDRYQVKAVLVASNILLAATCFGMALFSLEVLMCLFLVKNLLLDVSRCATEKLLPLVVEVEKLAKFSAQLSMVRHVSTVGGLFVGTIVSVEFSYLVFGLDGLTFVAAFILLGFLSIPIVAKSNPILVCGTGLGVQRASSKVFVKYFFANQSNRSILFMFVACHVGWGMKDIVGINLITTHYGVDPSLYGLYCSVAVFAELLCAAIVSCSLGRVWNFNRKQVWWWVVMLAVFFAGNMFFNSPTLGFVLKFLEGCASVMVGLVGGYFLVLKAPHSIRGTVSGVVTSLSCLGLILGKVSSGLLIEHYPPQLVYLVVGMMIFLSTLILYIFMSRDRGAAYR